MKTQPDTIDLAPVRRALEVCPRKNVVRYANLILKRFASDRLKSVRPFSFHSVACLEEISALARYLYLFEAYDACWDVCSLLDSVVFEGDYTLWYWIKLCRILKCCIARRRGDEAAAQEALSAVLPTLHPELYQNQWDSYLDQLEFHEKLMTDPEFRKKAGWADKKGALRESSQNVCRAAFLLTAISFETYLQTGGLPEYQAQMRDWSAQIFDYLRRAEP